MSATSAGQEPAPAEAPLHKAVFVEKDGTLVEKIPHHVDPDLLQLMPDAMAGLRLLAAHGFKLIVVTNQPGIAYGMFTRAQLTRLQLALRERMADEGVLLTDFFACPHAPGPAGRVPGCLCRKPAPGLLRQAARAHGIDLHRSWMIGDLLDDVEAGRRAGCKSVLLDVGNETMWRMTPLRTPHLRSTNLLEAAQAVIAQDESPTPMQPASAVERARLASPKTQGVFERSRMDGAGLVWPALRSSSNEFGFFS